VSRARCAICDLRRVGTDAHVSRPEKIILQAVCARVFADTAGLGGEERGDRRRDGRCQLVGGGLRW
jgi:hypothetical protein